MKTPYIKILSLATCIGMVPQHASAELLAGFHQFDDAATGSAVKVGADEGIFAATGKVTYITGSTSTGGSTDNWYGPDSIANGGAMTNQTPFLTTSPPVLNGPYVAETTDPLGPRLQPGYAVNPPTPLNTAGGGDSTADGRIRSFNGTDLEITNTSTDTYMMTSFVFDAFVGDSSTVGAVVNIGDFVVSRFGTGGDITSINFLASAGYAGYNTLSGEALDTALADPELVNNRIDYGVGTNYLDYRVNLNGFLFRPGDVLTVGLNATAIGAAARGDNFAFFGTRRARALIRLGDRSTVGPGSIEAPPQTESQTIRSVGLG